MGDQEQRLEPRSEEPKAKDNHGNEAEARLQRNHVEKSKQNISLNNWAKRER